MATTTTAQSEWPTYQRNPCVEARNGQLGLAGEVQELAPLFATPPPPPPVRDPRLRLLSKTKTTILWKPKQLKVAYCPSTIFRGKV